MCCGNVGVCHFACELSISTPISLCTRATSTFRNEVLWKKQSDSSFSSHIRKLRSTFDTTDEPRNQMILQNP